MLSRVCVAIVAAIIFLNIPPSAPQNSSPVTVVQAPKFVLVPTLLVRLKNRTTYGLVFDCGFVGRVHVEHVVRPGFDASIPAYFMNGQTRREIPIYEVTLTGDENLKNDMLTKRHVGTLIVIRLGHQAVFKFDKPTFRI